jgi:hypothetical protein
LHRKRRQFHQVRIFPLIFGSKSATLETIQQIKGVFMMKKITVMSAVAAAILLCSAASAKVTFLPASSAAGSVSSGKQALSNPQRCLNAGYQKTSCAATQQLTGPCPYSGQYYQSCECKSEYIYTAAECTQNGLYPSALSCNGKYACQAKK